MTPDDLAMPVDAETALAGSPPGHKDELRLWLRLLTCAKLIEAEIRRRLRLAFDTTLPRFDLLAQLQRSPAGLTLGEVSRRMMVSNGNVTGLASRLEQEGLIERRTSATDRRAQTLRLTSRGRREFARQTAAHEGWVAELLGGLSELRTCGDAPPARPHQGQRPRRPAGEPAMIPLAEYAARHVRLEVAGPVATLTLDRPERKNPLTFESYAELGAIFRAAARDEQVKVFVLTGAGGNFCSGGDVHEIIGPLLERDTRGLMNSPP